MGTLGGLDRVSPDDAGCASEGVVSEKGKIKTDYAPIHPFMPSLA